MTRNLSIYLDVLRIMAAMAVFLGHARGLFMPVIPIIIGAQAGQAVAVFFVLSGFVIGFVAERKEFTWQEYFKARLARMLSVVALAILVTLLSDRIGHAANPALYDNFLGFNKHTTLTDVVRSLTFTNQIWFSSVVVGTNQPYWSLGYEVPYYLAFGLFIFCKNEMRLIALVLWLALVGPRVGAFFPLWLLGVFTYRQCRRETHSNTGMAILGFLLFVGSVFLYAIIRFVAFKRVDNIFTFNNWQSFLVTWIYFHLIGVSVAMNIIGFRLLFERNLWPRKLASTIQWLAGASFTLYIVHLPILLAVLSLFPSIRTPTYGIMAIFGVLVLVLMLAEIGERRKGIYKRVVNVILSFRLSTH